MEPRKGADGLLAPLTKAASARFALALAAALALACAGCGGDEPEGDQGPPLASEPAASKAAPPGATQDDSSSPGSPGPSAKGAGPGGEGAQARGAGAAKEGPQVAPPKGPRESALTPEQRESAKLASIALESPAVLPVANGPAELPAAYTCDGRDSWPALRWRGLPEGTAELALFAMNLAPVEGKLFFDWAVAGIDPASEEIEAGRLPRGAVMGQNSFGRRGYSICPPQGQGETYFFALYALPERLAASPGFDPRELRKEVQELSRNVGLLPLTYTRG
jgi:phosphatidylethanolamine-binding protein (PEBP) family uncharacterized protein